MDRGVNGCEPNLVNYSSSESDSDNETYHSHIHQQRLLPPPTTIAAMFSSEDETPRNKDVSQDGKVRSFPHLEGNWATHVLIQYDPDEEFFHLQSELFKCLRVVGEVQPMNEYHTSLSRTIVIRHHWIEPLVESLRFKFCTYKRFCYTLNDVALYTNDDRSRTFLALSVSAGTAMSDLTEIVNGCLAEYNLPPYYQNASYHMSIGWLPGDVRARVSHVMLTSLSKIFSDDIQGGSFLDIRWSCIKSFSSKICHTFWAEENVNSRIVQVNHIICKAGNRQFIMPLSSL